MRPRMSVGPPGGNGRISRMGLLGQATGACAPAGHGASAIAAASSSRPPVLTPKTSGVLGVGGCLGLRRRRALFEELRGRHVLARAVVREPRPRRDETPDDDVLLQAAQVILLAHDRRFG